MNFSSGCLLPQIRIYPYLIRDPAGPRDFHKKDDCFRSDNFREPSIGPQLYGRKQPSTGTGRSLVRVEALTELGGQAVERVFIGNPSVATSTRMASVATSSTG